MRQISNIMYKNHTNVVKLISQIENFKPKANTTYKKMEIYISLSHSFMSTFKNYLRSYIQGKRCYKSAI